MEEEGIRGDGFWLSRPQNNAVGFQTGDAEERSEKREATRPRAEGEHHRICRDNHTASVAAAKSRGDSRCSAGVVELDALRLPDHHLHPVFLDGRREERPGEELGVDLGGVLDGADRARVSNRAVDPVGDGGGGGGRGGGGGVDGEGESVERAVAVGGGAVEFEGKGAVEIEAGAGEGRDGAAVAPVEGEEAAGLAGRGAGDGGFLEEGNQSSLFGEEVGGAHSYHPSSTNHHFLPITITSTVSSCFLFLHVFGAATATTGNDGE